MSLRLTAWRWHFIFVSTQDSFTAVRHLQLSAFSQSSSGLPCVYFGRLGKPWNSVVRLFSSVFLRDLWYDSPHNIGCVADMHRSSLLSPSFLIISSYLFDFPLFFFNAASTNFTYLFPLEYQPRISVCQHLQVWWEEASLQIALYISGADLTYCAIILWFTGVLNGKIGLYFLQLVPSRGLNWHSSLVRPVLRVQWSIFISIHF